MPRTFVAALALVLAGASQAAAVTARDLVELTRAGLSDEVLIALIEADRSRFELDARQILELRAAGVSERVLVSMLKSDEQAREAEAPGRPGTLPESDPADAASRAPSAADVERLAVPVLVVPVSVPVLVPVPVVPRGRNQPTYVDPSGQYGFGPFINTGHRGDPLQPASPPVYWGWGGKRRPDTWNEPSATRNK